MPAPTTLPTNVAAGGTGHISHTNTVHGIANGITVVPVAAVSSSRALTLNDCGEHLAVSSSSAVTITLPTNASVAMPVGVVVMVGRFGTGSVTVAAAAGVTLRNAAAAATLRAQYSVASVQKIATDEWVLSGDLG